MKNKTILITGAAGFIGFHVAKYLLQEGREVVGVDNLNEYYDISLKKSREAILMKFPNFTFYKKDIAHYDEIENVFRSHKVDSICHLAAQAGVRYSLQNPLVYEETNIKGFLNILEIAQKTGIRDVIYASSSSVYGNNFMPENGFSEKDRVDQQISVYGMTKRSNELLAFTYHHLYGLHTTGLRFFTVYGPWGRPDMAYYKFVDAIFKDKTIDVYNNGKMQRDFTYIDDAVKGVVEALEKSYPHEIFNLGNSRTISLMDFIATIEEVTGKKFRKNFLPVQPGDVVETFANITHAKEKLGFDPKTKIDKGMELFITWYKEYYHLNK